MQTIARTSFTTVKTEGGLLPADLLQRIADGRNVDGLRPEDYHLLPGERLNEAINRAWNRCLGAWLSFDEQRGKLPDHDTGTTLTRERWLLVLFQELGYGRLLLQRGGLQCDDGTTYPISHLWELTPIHLVTFRQGLDRRGDGATQVKRSPHSLVQELLNRSRQYTWGFISNGLQLRILRDNASLRRAAYVEFDLQSMMAGELYAEFSLLWLVCHQSRLEEVGGRETGGDSGGVAEEEDAEEIPTPEAPLPTQSSWLERWSKLAADQGTRAMDALRDGVAEAIAALGSGFLAQPTNQALRARLQSGELSTQSYYQQLRRLVYRMIFLFVAEDRDLLLLPATPPAVRKRYDAYYSLRRVREMAGALRGGPHTDLYRQVRQLFVLLRMGYPDLGLPGLGSFLFSDRSTPDLDAAELANRSLLGAIRALSFTVEASVRRSVDYRNLDSEELGSIYESLLELHPQVNTAAGTFELVTGAGSERKTTGSHYTATPLVENLLDTALEPVVAERLRTVTRDSSLVTHDASLVTSHESYVIRAERAILAIKVCDFAAGSGHMLIGAGRRLAKHLARVRTGDDEPAPADLRAAMRDVVRHCLYGVDINDMAVELCKVALWMETLEPGKPLSFLDAHIQCGNSLIGVTPGLDIAEIPDDAFQPVTGDDKATAAGLRRRNKKEREGQLALHFGDAEAPGSTDRHAGKRAQMVAAIEDLAEDAVADVAAKEHSYADYLQSTEYKWARWEADTWTAAFFWPIPAGDPGSMAAPTQEVLRTVRAGKLKQVETVLREVRRMAKQHQFFHWALQFPEVLGAGGMRHESPVTSHESPLTHDASLVTRDHPGFDVLLSNPPWERIKLQEKEWFAARSPEIAGAPNAAARKRLIAALQTEDPALWQAFQQDVRAAESESHFIRNSGHYPLCGRGDVNTYAVFAELARQVHAPAGRAGIIVPTGIATDDTTKYYFQDIMETGALASLYDFENRHKLFPAVDSRMKFCLLTLSSRADSPGKLAEFVFFALDADDLRDVDRRFTLTAEEIALLNPNTRTCPIFRSRHDAELTKAIYRRVPVLITEGPPEKNPWGVNFSTMFHMSNDSHLFRTREQLEAEGWRLEGNRFVRGGEVYLPLYEGRLGHQYNHRFASQLGGVLRESTRIELQNPDYWAGPQYFVPLGLLGEGLRRRESKCTSALLGHRRVSRNTDERTTIACLFKWGPASYGWILSTGPDPTHLCYLVAVYNSFAFDYLLRNSLSQPSIPQSTFEQIPAPVPTQIDATLSSHILPCVLELTYTAWDLEPFAQDIVSALGDHPYARLVTRGSSLVTGHESIGRLPPFRWDEARRFLLRCELDAAYFHLYGIERDDVDYIMETFPIVKRKDIKAHGEYRTKRVILEIYDEIAAAMQSGVPYQTRLDPPPADPRVAHDS